MATNFKLWIDEAISTGANPNVQTAAAFASDTSRHEGWHAGNTVSSLKVNSILRQNSLIVASIMEAFCSDNTTLSLVSSLNDVKTALLAGIASKSALDTLSGTVSNLSTTVGNLSTTVSTLNTDVTKLKNGTTKAGDSELLDGHDSTYFQKAILVGTAAPTAALGSNGDIYIQYTN